MNRRGLLHGIGPYLSRNFGLEGETSLTSSLYICICDTAIIASQATGKKVIVSMANIAGSGGYFLAMAADIVIINSDRLCLLFFSFLL
jgi:hypothetical protein